MNNQTRYYSNWNNLPVLLTLEEVCAITRLTDVTVMKLVSSGALTAARTGRGYLFPKNKLQEYFHADEQPAAPPDEIAQLMAKIDKLVDCLNSRAS